MSKASLNIPRSLRELWDHQDKFGRAAIVNDMSQKLKGRAIVSRAELSQGPWKLEDVTVRSPGEGELLVEMVGSGVCHTDVLVGSLPGQVSPLGFYPRVLGHEGKDDRARPRAVLTSQALAM